MLKKIILLSIAFVGCTINAVEEGELYGYDELQGQAYRGNMLRNGLYETTGLPKLNGLKWKFKTEGKVRSSPVVHEGVCYIGSLDKSFYAIDVETGKQKWAVKTGGEIYGSACVYNGEVFFASNDRYLYAVNSETGKIRLKLKIAVQKGKNAYIRSSPAIAYGTVFISVGLVEEDVTNYVGWIGNTYAYDIETGKLLSTYEQVGGKQFASPAVKDDLLVVMTRYGFTSYDLVKGDMIVNNKCCHAKAQVSHSSPVIVGKNRLFMMMVNLGGLTEGTINKSNHKSRTYISPKIKPGKILSVAPIEYVSYVSPLVVEEVIYGASDLGILTTIGTSKNGSGMGKANRGWTFDAKSEIRSSPVYANKTIYFACMDGTIYAVPQAPFKGESPKKLWKFKIGAGVYSTIWAGDGAIYVGSDDGFVYCLK